MSDRERSSGGDGRYPLEPTADEMKAMAAQTMERIARFIETLPRQPASDIEGGEALAHGLSAPMPERGSPLGPILDLLFDRAVPKAFNTTGPGYLAYIPGGGLFEAGLADLIADTVNRFTGIWMPAPLLVQLEADVLRWLCGIVGYGPASSGFLTTGGSLANLSALITARHEKLGESFADGAMYVSDQAHHSVRKAARLAGFPGASVRVVPTDERFRLLPDALLARLKEDRASALRPFLIVASAGTTNTGAVDPLPELAEIARREGLWLHVDAAYGGFFVLTERGRRALSGIECADSIVLDPHKGMFLPYGTGCLLAKDGETLRHAHSVPADYLPTMQQDAERLDFSEISPELSRDYRGLRVWLPLQLRGTRAFQDALDEKLDLAEWAHEELRTIEGIEIVAAPQLSLVAFRLRRAGFDGDALDALNHDFLARINARGRVYLSATTVGRMFVLRICVLSFRTHRDRMEMALEDIRAAAAELR